MTSGLEIHTWDGIGFQPLVASHDWLVSILNWEPIFSLDKFGEVERHNETDEIFVLTRGQALLFTSDDKDLRVEIMIPGAVFTTCSGEPGTTCLPPGMPAGSSWKTRAQITATAS